MYSWNRQIICSIGICTLVCCLSGVSLLYLTVMVYLPAKRLLEADINPEPVKCKTVTAIEKNTKDCSWATCSEWCLSTNTAECMHIWVSVRNNGSDFTFTKCSRRRYDHCALLEPYQAMVKNCTNHPTCRSIHGLHNCTNGQCVNIDPFYECATSGFDPNDNCKIRDRCNALTGVYSCVTGSCQRLRPRESSKRPKSLYPRCQRKCHDVNVNNRTVVIFTSMGFLTARCDSVVEKTQLEKWNKNSVLFMNCARAQLPLEADATDQVIAEDCYDGITVSQESVKDLRLNHSEIMAYHKNLTYHKKGDIVLPLEESVMIRNKTRFMINLEGCVNTLKDECNTMFAKLGIDGGEETNFQPPPTFPCYYGNSTVDQFVLLRYDPQATYEEAVKFAAVPTSLFILSCIFLVCCSKVTDVRGPNMYLKCCPEEGDDSSDDEMAL